jgi:hypothetical protein
MFAGLSIKWIERARNGGGIHSLSIVADFNRNAPAYFGERHFDF